MSLTLVLVCMVGKPLRAQQSARDGTIEVLEDLMREGEVVGPVPGMLDLPRVTFRHFPESHRTGHAREEMTIVVSTRAGGCGTVTGPHATLVTVEDMVVEIRPIDLARRWTYPEPPPPSPADDSVVVVRGACADVERSIRHEARVVLHLPGVMTVRVVGREPRGEAVVVQEVPVTVVP